jgi:hypothetical protein
MAIRLTDDDEDYNRPNNNRNRNTGNDDTGGSSGFNISDSDKKTAGIAALIGVVLLGLWKFPKLTIFLLLVAGAVLYYMYGDQELLRQWGIKQ